MNVGDLFVNLGIKGTDKTVGALTGVKDGLGSVSSMSLEAKAGILAALYAFEQMTSASFRAGTSMENFAAYTGLSMKTLQQWQWAGTQAGETAEDMEASIKGVQKAVNAILLNKGTPEGYGIVDRAVGLDRSRLRDTFYLLGKLRDAAKILPTDVGQNIIESFHVTPGFLTSSRRGALDDKNLQRAPILGDGELKALDQAHIKMENLGRKAELMFSHFFAKHGNSMVDDITKIADQIFRMVEGLEQLSEKLKVFKAMSAVFGLIANVMGAVTDEVEGKKATKKSSGYLAPILQGRDKIDKKIIDFFSSYVKPDQENDVPIAPSVSAARSSSRTHIDNSKRTTHITVQGGNTKDVVDAAKKGAADYVKSSPGVNQGT